MCLCTGIIEVTALAAVAGAVLKNSKNGLHKMSEENKSSKDKSSTGN